MYITNNTSRIIEITYRNNNNLLLSVQIRPYALLQEVRIAEANKQRFLQACKIWQESGKIVVQEEHPDSIKEVEHQAQEASDTFDAQTAEAQTQLDEIYNNISEQIADAGEQLSGATETNTTVSVKVVENKKEKSSKKSK